MSRYQSIESACNDFGLREVYLDLSHDDKFELFEIQKTRWYVIKRGKEHTSQRDLIRMLIHAVDMQKK